MHGWPEAAMASHSFRPRSLTLSLSPPLCSPRVSSLAPAVQERQAGLRQGDLGDRELEGRRG